MISNKHYLDETVFEAEKNYMLNNSWILAAHSNELQKKNDFVTINYLGKKIFIQNFGDTIKAFDNICLHRFYTIHAETHGNRLPICNYHLWSYDKNGLPAGIQNRKNFAEQSLAGLALQQYEIALCGKFVFVKLNQAFNTPLPQYLGALYQPLQEISQHFGDKIADYYLKHECNWKLIAENVLECYHCKSVHENSFAKMGFGFLPPTEEVYAGAHSYCNFPNKEGVFNFKVIDKTLKSRTLQFDGYKHFYIFPNAFITSVKGYGFYLGFLFPESSTITDLRVRNFTPGFQEPLSEGFKNILEFMNDGQNSSLATVLKEDKSITETIQKNLTVYENKSPLFGDEERRINQFYDFYNQAISPSQ